jgi:hypothetical protein
MIKKNRKSWINMQYSHAIIIRQFELGIDDLFLINYTKEAGDPTIFIILLHLKLAIDSSRFYFIHIQLR